MRAHYARALTFNIAYSMLHKISFRMSRRLSLCVLWFSQTLRHKFDLYILIGWQAYRGDQIHRKNSPTEPRNQIQVKYEKHLPGL